MPITRTCRISGKEFVITDQEIALLEKLSPVIGGERFAIPLPDITPSERQRRKLPFKNYLSLFKGKDSKTGEKLISSYPPDTTYTIYSQPRWWSDDWDPMSYAQDFDPHTPIADQIYSVWHSVPVPALDNAYREVINSEYINGNGPSKECYLTSNSAYNERCLYGWMIFHSSDILDSNYITDSEYCSYSQHLWKCYDVHLSWDSSECRNSRYLFSCEGCQNILGGVALKNQKYQILNTPCTKEEFDITLQKLQYDIPFRKDFEKKLRNLIKKIGLEPSSLTGSENSTGDFCYDSKNAHECYDVGDCEDVLYITDSYKSRDSAHISMWGDGTTLSYDCIDVGQNISHVYFSSACWEGAIYNLYSHKCNNCQYVFGCSGLRNKSYCIFNKQYTKEDWEATVKRIIHQMEKEGTWGEFLDQKYATFAYNESLGSVFAPISREEALSGGYLWSDRVEAVSSNIAKVIDGQKLPDTIKGIPDDILVWVIQCIKTEKYFQVQPLELELLRKFGIPIPKIHPIERIKMRLEWDKREFHFDF